MKKIVNLSPKRDDLDKQTVLSIADDAVKTVKNSNYDVDNIGIVMHDKKADQFITMSHGNVLETIGMLEVLVNRLASD